MTEEDLELGRQIAEQRKRKVPWKVIQRQTGLGRTKLNELMWAATGGGGVEALAAQVAAEVRAELDKSGCVDVQINGRTVAFRLSAEVIDPL